MTTEAPIFTPDIEELLREIAQQPDSVLLRVPREKVKASLLETRSPIGPMTAGLTSAERELVRVHREEFAFQLRRACWVKLATGDAGAVFLSRTPDSKTEHRIPSRNEIAPAIRSISKHDSLSAIRESASWVSLPVAEWPTVSDICAIVHTFSPSDQNRIYAGADWALRGELSSASHILHEVLLGSDCSAFIGAAYSHLAFCQDRMHALRSSAHSWHQAYKLLPHRMDILPFWFSVAIRSGDKVQIPAADRALSAAFGCGSEFILSHARLLRLKLARGFWSREPVYRQAVAYWLPRLGHPARELVHGLE